ncbi:MAG: type I restriction endonuclease subunit R [Thiotrichales bacterium]|nr:type I restriction endonuclease subunit R [Thiotrichales bacterium]
MAVTAVNSEDRLVQTTFAEHLEGVLGWDSVYAWNEETFGPDGALGRADTREAVLTRDLRAALERLNPDLPTSAVNDAIRDLTAYDVGRSAVQHNRDFHRLIRGGVPVEYRDAHGRRKSARARVIDFDNPPGSNRFLAVRELKLTGIRTPNYNRRADLVCFVNGLPLVFIELKAVYRNIREGFDNNLSDYLDENVIAHAFHHNAFLIVSNGDRARYGSITSGWEHFAEWKRLDEMDTGRLDAEVMLNGMLAHDPLLDIVENFILFDESKPGATRKVVARNHQVLGVNRAVASVRNQETLKLEFPPGRRLTHRIVELPLQSRSPEEDLPPLPKVAEEPASYIPAGSVDIVERAHPDLGRLGVFWHTQGSGKSYSMAFFAEKVRRKLDGNFTFLLMTDRNDLDGQIYGTFVGCGIADDNTPRAASGDDLERRLKENHRYVFSLIHKFNKDVDPKRPYSERGDIIVISDEAHRTQAGRLARNMRLALPNAAFIGFTGTPLFKQDEITKRIFGDYISRYDFKRSEEDGATVKLVYENRGEKLGLARLDLNDRIAEKIEEAELDPDREALLEKLLGQDYEVITADERLDRIAADFVEHCATRWQSGKSMLVCVDKITCARMYQRIVPRWRARAAAVRKAADARRAEAEAEGDESIRAALAEKAEALAAQAAWLDETIVEIIISGARNEVRDFAKWGFDIVPHRARMKQGFETADGKRVDVEKAFKNPEHPFRVAIVCAMWLTGFDVECLSTLYIDKPMKAHSLMQAIARANRVWPGKDFGLIVDYNGMLKSLREALAQYALGDDGDTGGEAIVAPIEERMQALIEAIEATEAHLRRLGFDPATLIGSTGFTCIEGLKDAVEAVYTSDETKRRFEVLARQVFIRFKALLTEPSAFPFAERHDNIEAIYKKLSERRDTADVTALLKALHRIVNEAIRTRAPGDDQAEGLTFDLSRIDAEKLREEFAKKVRCKATALRDIREIVEQKLAEMLARNPSRMDYQQKYEAIVADYNREKDRVTVEETFRRLMELVEELDVEQRRAVEEGLGEDELAIFDLLKKENLGRAERERVKQASRDLLASIKARLKELDRFWEKEQTKADIEVLIRDKVYASLPTPPFSPEEKDAMAAEVYTHVWQQAVHGEFAMAA